ncbi:MAG: alpha/beta hydrolase [Microbacterium sp.]
MAQSFWERRRALKALGEDLTPGMVAGTLEIAAQDIDPAIFEGVEVIKDVTYGPHERHVLDVYRPAGTFEADRPVLIFVHGGGFVRGAKDSESGPFFGNIGSWAVQQGWVAVVINYRLAPEHRYPSGARDVAASVTWAVENISTHGGDPTRIFLSGQSAGSMHVADYIVGHGGFGTHGRALAGAVLASCLYDVARASSNDMHIAYWGDDPAAWADYGTLQGLIDTDLPLLLTVSEFDVPEFQAHAAQLVAEWQAQRRTYPPMHRLYGQNHLTPVYGIGSPWDNFGPLLRRFIDANS